MVPFLRYAPEHGLILQGQTGIGKTPLARALSMAVSQHYIAEDGLEIIPSVRSCACLDMLRTEPGVKHKPVIYDDGPLDNNKAADVKAMMDVQEEEVLIWARWGSIKLVKAQHRCIITNPLGEKPDVAMLDFTIPHESFVQLVSPAFMMGMPEQDFMAICKRAFHVVFLKDRAYIRPPSEHKIPVRQFVYPVGPMDLLKDEVKPTLAMYKRGDQPDMQRIEANRKWSEVLVRKCFACEHVDDFITENADIVEMERPLMKQVFPIDDDHNKQAQESTNSSSAVTSNLSRGATSSTSISRPTTGPMMEVKEEPESNNDTNANKQTKTSRGTWSRALKPSQSTSVVIEIDDEDVPEATPPIDPVDLQLLDLMMDDIADDNETGPIPEDLD